MFVDHVMGKAVAVDPFFLFAGSLSTAQAPIKHLTVRELRKEHVAPLALALRTNRMVATLVLEGSFSSRGVKTELRMELPVQALVGHQPLQGVDLSSSGEIGRISCDLIGALVCENSSIETLDLSRTQVGFALDAAPASPLPTLCTRDRPRGAFAAP